MRYFNLIIFLLFPFIADAQKDTITSYYDLQWNAVDKKNAAYYRKAFRDNEGHNWLIRDYYINGQINMSGSSEYENLQVKDGHFVFYYENGNKSSEGEYSNDKCVGDWTSWHSGGEIKEQGSFDLNGEKAGLWKLWYEDGNLSFEGSYVDGKKQGEWNYYYDNGQVASAELYENDYLLSFDRYTRDGHKQEDGWVEESMPEFAGGESKLSEFLVNNVKYPPKARDKNAQGMVYIGFVISRNGSIINCEVLSSPHPALGEEGLRVVRLMPKWTPGISRNRPVDVFYTLPIKFTLIRD